MRQVDYSQCKNLKEMPEKNYCWVIRSLRCCSRFFTKNKKLGGIEHYNIAAGYTVIERIYDEE